MKATFPGTFLMVAGSLMLTGQETEVRCTDGSRIRGSLLGIGSDRVELGADSLVRPVPLRLDKILDLSLPFHAGGPQGGHVATVTLSNGDILRGELSGVNDREIRLKTWYAGELAFRRVMVDTLEIKDQSEIIYAGPAGLEGWVRKTENAWIYGNGALWSKGSGSIGRELKLPEKVRFAFDLTWRSSAKLRFVFCGDTVDKNLDMERPRKSYELVFRGRVVQLQKNLSRKGGGGSIGLEGSFTVGELQNNTRCRIEVRVDRKAGLIRLLVNNRVVKEWTDSDLDDGILGGGIQFGTVDSSQVRVSRIEVTTWDDLLDKGASADGKGLVDGGDAASPGGGAAPGPSPILLRNNDRIAGEIVAIDGERAKLKTTFGEVYLKLSSFRSFPVRAKEARDEANWDLGLYEIPKRYSGDVRACFPDGGSITFRITGIDHGKLTGTAQTFGSAVFDQKAFSRIEFNIHDPGLEAIRSKAEGW